MALDYSQANIPESRDSNVDQAVSRLGSVHTPNLPAILGESGISLLVTTYQSGHLVMLRPEPEAVNTHFREFDKPMGLAVGGNRLVVGTAMQVIEFHNLPDVGSRLEQSRTHDAVYLPRVTHWTGNIHIHEMAWVTNEYPDRQSSDSGLSSKRDRDLSELWFVNTAFSCLCRRSDQFSFDPVWRPRFITEYMPADCCHLNGLGTVDGRAKYVTALGETAEPQGWRNNKRDGGVLIDIESNEVVLRGLSMPHSPRWYGGKLWLLESGRGTLGFVDLDRSRYEPVVELPGFTRGLSFFGPFAFVGLSQVRETATFGGIPIAERDLKERQCGVWVVDLRNGQVAAFLKFEDAVQEVFAVEVLPDCRFPDVINHDRDIIGTSFELHDDVLADVPENLANDSVDDT